MSKNGLGLKTLGILSLTTGILIFAWKQGRFQFDVLSNLSPPVAFTITLFTSLAGTLFIYLWRLETVDKIYLRLTSKRMEQETPLIESSWVTIVVGSSDSVRKIGLQAFGKRVFVYLGCFGLALLCFNTRAVDLLTNARKKWAVSANFCQEEAVDIKSESLPQGCQLVERAFKLGLTKDLGNCSKDVPQEKLEVCNLRQLDEPLLHFSFRLFKNFIQASYDSLKQYAAFKKTEALFTTRLRHSPTLLSRLGHVLEGSPRAAHHIFTNLPPPPGTQSGGKENNCLAVFRQIPHILKNDASASEVLEHAYGQMLFDPKFDNSVGLCSEYTIHWGFPLDTCSRMTQSPETFFKGANIQNPLNTVFKRTAEQLDFKILQEQLKWIITGQVPLPPAPPPPLGPLDPKPLAPAWEETVISFQCLMQAQSDQSVSVKEWPFRFHDHSYVAREVRFPALTKNNLIHTEMYKYLSEALVGDFQYEHDASAERINTAGLLERTDYPLARLELLKQLDIFSEQSWLQNREDLLEVYPYYHHLKYFIDLFREEYRSQRTRL